MATVNFIKYKKQSAGALIEASQVYVAQDVHVMYEYRGVGGEELRGMLYAAARLEQSG